MMAGTAPAEAGYVAGNAPAAGTASAGARTAPSGTTLADPVTVEHKPDLGSSLYEITEYLEKQQAYDLFAYLLRDLLVAQPKDPLQHLVDCLQVQVPTGPLQVFVTSPPGVGRSKLCRNLAKKFGLTYISAGELLRDAVGVDVSKIDLASDKDVTTVVLDAVKQAKSMMQGFVLDGFPRTRMQTSVLQEHAVVPTHVLLLKAKTEQILERQRLEGEVVDPEVMAAKLNQFTCHQSIALETYTSKIKVIDAFAPSDFVASEMERVVRMLPRSKGPACPPRVVIVGARGSGLREHASRLASRLGAVFIDGERMQSSLTRQGETGFLNDKAASPCSPMSMTTSIDLPKERLTTIAREDALGEVGIRLRQPDCKKQGYVMCGCVNSQEIARVMAEDIQLSPTRVIALRTSADVCVNRLRHLAVDKVTGKVWTYRPQSDQIRQRLQKSPQNVPAAVTAACQAYEAKLPSILEAFGCDGRCTEFQADGDPEDTYSNVIEFVERPLPIGSSRN